MLGTFCDVHMFKFMIMFTWCFTMGEAHSLWIGIKGHYPKILAGLNYHHARSLILGMAPRCENKCGYSITYSKGRLVPTIVPTMKSPLKPRIDRVLPC